MTDPILTANETAALTVLFNECLSAMGGSCMADLRDDPLTWVDAETLVAAGWSKESAAGTFSSLAAKGVIFEYDPNDWILDDLDLVERLLPRDVTTPSAAGPVTLAATI